MEYHKQGLTTQEAEQLLAQYGKNRIEPPPQPGFLKKLAAQLNNFLIILLLIAGIVSLGIGEFIDGGLILTIVVLNALFGIYQENKAEAAIEALSDMTVTKSRVIRDGTEKEIDSTFIVPGDILYLEEGSKVPADAQVLQSMALEVNESALTGESLPVAKKSRDEIFMGTIVAKGRAYARVTKTGALTKFGDIASHLAAVKRQATPLQKKLEGLSKILGIIGISASLVVLGLSYAQGESYLSSFLLAVSLAVAVVPEGLPAVLTITLAIGVKEMAKKRSIVRKLSAVEAFGSITLIATDKTGTLTENKMKVKEVWASGEVHEIKEGSANDGKFFDQAVGNIVRCATVCSTASLVPVHHRQTASATAFDVLGDPTEGALLMLAEARKTPYDALRADWQIAAELPFDAVTKRMSVCAVSKTQAGEAVQIFTKGATESVITLCDQIVVNGKTVSLTAEIQKEIVAAQRTWAKKGLRVLGFAQKTLSQECKTSNELEKNLKGMVFLGMVAIHDRPRPEAAEAIRRAHEAGIAVVMITGDNEYTAEAVGSTVGIMRSGDQIVNGAQLDRYSDEELLAILPKTRIFARTTPFHKKRIVDLFQKLGEVVAVTGDGVNDSIALKAADVGVAMGLVGTDVAREAADMVITDDNFATIVNAIEEGRHIIRNVNSAIVYLISCNVVEALSLITGLIIGIPHIFYPIQLLYVNLVTDGLPALAIAYSPREEHLMRKPPQKTPSLLGKNDYRYIFINGIIGTVLVFMGYGVFRMIGGAWSSIYGQEAAFTILVLIQSFVFIDIWFHHTNVLPKLLRSQKPIFYAAFLMPIILQFIIIRTPFLAQLFNVLPMEPALFMILMGIASSVLFFLRITDSRSHKMAKV